MNAPVPLVAIRHAPTEWNREKRLQGRTDIPLGEIGEAVAQNWVLPQAWRDYRVISSPLQRARRTAEILFPDRGIVLDERLMEIAFGDWEGKVLADLRDLPGGDAKARESLGLDFTAPGGETPRQVQERIHPLLVEIAASGQPTIAVCHKAVIRSMMSLATGWDMLGKPPVKLLTSTAHAFAVDRDGGLSVLRMNLPLVIS